MKSVYGLEVGKVRKQATNLILMFTKNLKIQTNQNNKVYRITTKQNIL